MSKKSGKAKSPSKLAKTGKTSGVALTESQLGQAQGGLTQKIGFKY